MRKIYLLLFSISLIIMPVFAWSQKAKASREFYQIIIYRYTGATQEKILDNYLRDALLPALHQQKIKKVGVFKAIANDTATEKLLYVFMPLKSLNSVNDITQDLAKNKSYLAAATDYINAPYNAPAYNRLEKILLQAFTLAPKMMLPALKGSKNERVYELRSYESASEEIFKNKVHMFNEGGEIEIFKGLNFNAVFYGEVVAGAKMPNLMYMTSFENKADRDAHWKSFSSNPEWKKLSAMQEYKNNVSHIDISFLRPTEYSDF